MGLPKGEEQESRIEEIVKGMMTKNFPVLVMNIKPQIHEAQRIPSRRIP